MASIRGIGLVVPAWELQPARSRSCAPPSRLPNAVVAAGTPIGLQRVLGISCPVRQARYELGELGHPDLAVALAPILAAARPARPLDRGDRACNPAPQTREHLLRAMRREAYAFAAITKPPRPASTAGPEIAQLFERVATQEYFGQFVEQALEVG